MKSIIITVTTVGKLRIDGYIEVRDDSQRTVGLINFEQHESGSHLHRIWGEVPANNSRLDRAMMDHLRTLWVGYFQKGEICVWAEDGEVGS